MAGRRKRSTEPEIPDDLTREACVAEMKKVAFGAPGPHKLTALKMLYDLVPKHDQPVGLPGLGGAPKVSNVLAHTPKRGRPPGIPWKPPPTNPPVLNGDGVSAEAADEM